MKITTTRDALLTLLTPLSKVLVPRPTDSILTCVRAACSKGELSFTASDGETQVTVRADEETACDKDGTILCDGKLLLGCARELPEGEITMELEDGANIAVLTWPNGQSRIPAFDDTYPLSPIPAADDEESCNLKTDASTLSRGLGKVLYAALKDDLRPVLETVLIETGDSLSFTATNTKILANTAGKEPAGQKAALLLPGGPAKILLSLLPDDDTEVEITADNRRIMAKTETITIITRRQDGRYPNYKSIFPKNVTTTAVANRMDLVRAVSRVALYADSGNVVFETTPDGIRLTGENLLMKASAHEDFACTITGPTVKAGFKAEFLKEILSHLCGENVEIGLVSESRPALFRSTEESGFTEETVLMPVMTSTK